LELLDLLGDGRQVGVDLVLKQAALIGVKSFRLRSKLHALQERVLVRELGAQRLAVLEFGLVADDLRILGAHMAHQAGEHLAQLLCAEIVQGLRLHQHGLYCASEPQP